jgi:hypothetical protein
MSKLVAAILVFLIGLTLIVGGYTSLGTLYTTGLCLIIAGILVIVLIILKMMKMQCETKTPTK